MRLLLRLPIALLPTILTLLLLTVYLQVNPLDSVPVWSDEIFYWHQIETFREVGFNGGYYSFDELPPTAPSIRFGPHGPGFISLIGIPAKLTGWSYYSLPLYNYVIISIALAVLLLTVPFTRTQLLMLGVFLSTAWGLLLFIPTSQQETVHFAIAIISGCIFYRQLSSNDPLPLRWKLIFAAFFILAGFIKVTWTLMLLPLLVLDSRTWRETVLSVTVAGVITLAQFFLFTYWGAPYPLNYSRLLLRIFAQSPLEGLSTMVWYFGLNVRRVRLGDPLEIIQRYQILAFIIVTMTSLIAVRMRGTLWKRIRNWLSRRESTFHLFNLGVIFFLQVLVYDMFAWRDYRVFAPHLFLSILILIASNRLRFAGVMIAINVLCVGLFFNVYTDFARSAKLIDETQWSRYEAREVVDEFESIIIPHIIYDADATNAWCNTLLTETFYPHLLALPAGVGFGVTIAETFDRPFHSRYLLFSQEKLESFSNDINVEKLATTDIGDLYLNLDADCGA
jgi:hypothetical protein